MLERVLTQVSLATFPLGGYVASMPTSISPYNVAGRPRTDRPGTILLKRAMKRHGGTVDVFAQEVLGRSRVSIWRWLRKSYPIPPAVIVRLKAYLQESANV